MCTTIGDALTRSSVTIYEYQRHLVAAGILESEGPGPGKGVRATPTTVALLMLAVMCAAVRRGSLINDVRRLFELGRFDHPDARASAEMPELETFGRALTAMFGDPSLATRVNRIEVTAAPRVGRIFLDDAGGERGRELLYRVPTRHHGLTRIVRLEGEVVVQE